MAENPRPSPDEEPRAASSAVESSRSSTVGTARDAAPALAQALSITASAFAGPLPPPEVLAAYENALPGCAERIIRMAEEQGTHRRALEREELAANRKSQTRGQYLAFVLALVVSGGGIYLLATGQGVEGLVALLTPLAGLAGIFLINRSRAKKQVEMTKSPRSRLDGGQRADRFSPDVRDDEEQQERTE